MNARNPGVQMADGLARYQLDDGAEIVVAVHDDGADDRLRRASRAGEVVDTQQRFDAAVAVVTPVAESLLGRLRTMASAPDTVDVEFGVSLSLKAGAFIASSSAEANFTVHLSWSRHDR
jgi:hypothetical protein